MTHMLKKIPHPNFTSSHQYHQVPLNGESDSEDDEALLYAAPSLNHHQNEVSKRDSNFGVGMYDHSCDLDLPRVVQFPRKRKPRFKGGQRLVQSKAFACIFIVLACVLVAAIAAFSVLVAGNWDVFSSSVNATIPPDCPSVPKPLPDGTQPPCPPTSHTNSQEQPHDTTSATPTSRLPPAGDPTTSSPNAPPSQTTETAGRVSSEPTQGNDNGRHLSSSTADVFSSPDGEHSTDSVVVAFSSTSNPTISNSPSKTESVTDHTESPHVDHNSTETTTTSGSKNLDTSSPAPVSTTNSLDIEPPHTEKAPEDIEVDDTSCIPVPSPLLNNSPPGPGTSCQTSSSSSPASLQPTPALSDGSSQDSHDVTIPMEPVVTETTQPVSTNRPPTAAAATTESSEERAGSTRLSTEKHTSSTNGKRLRWERSFLPAASEATPTTVDLDGDGMEERLLVVDVSMNYVSVFALDGRDGSTRWNQTVNFPVFGVCCLMDISGDGMTDCFVNGRGGGLGALSGSDGRPIWFVDKSVVYPRYNFYFPLRVPDMDGDGVDDLVVTHGGDISYEPSEHNRSPGLLVAVSGKTGQKLIEPIPMPDGKETYMSPVLASVHGMDGNSVILFGSGGETVAGSLWGVSLSSFRDAVEAGTRGRSEGAYAINLDDTFHPQFLSPNRVPPRPTLNPTKFDVNHLRKDTVAPAASCPTWGGKQVPIWNDYNLCLYEFLRSEEKGVMLPPVIVDVNVDGVEDLVVSTFDGHTVVIDGRDMKHKIWDIYFPGTESYSVPTPLFYTADDVPDFLIRSSEGEWENGYVGSSLFVLDGRDGRVLWSHNSSSAGMMSTISLKAHTHGRDALIFYTVNNRGEDTIGQREVGGDGGPGRESGGEANGRGTATSSPPMGGASRSRRDGHMQQGREGGPQGMPMMGEARGVGGDFVDDDFKGVEDSVDYSVDPIHDSLTRTDPPELWQSNGPGDKLPHPLTREALLGYCGEVTGSLYLVNREMVESGMELKPVAHYTPHIYFAPGSSPIVADPRAHASNKRHVGGGPHQHSSDGVGGADNSVDPLAGKLHSSRCSHVTYPNGMVGTPLVTDLNGDGRLDVVYDIVWSSPRMAVPPSLMSVAADLEDLFEEAYGRGILDFDLVFEPPRDQPWSQYMGRNMDSVYRPPQS